jgi:hypothetical protein
VVELMHFKNVLAHPPGCLWVGLVVCRKFFVELAPGRDQHHAMSAGHAALQQQQHQLLKLLP